MQLVNNSDLGKGQSKERVGNFKRGVLLGVGKQYAITLKSMGSGLRKLQFIFWLYHLIVVSLSAT